MRKLLSQVKENILYHHLVYIYFFLFSINALATAIVTSFLNVEWRDLSPTSKFLLVILVLQNWTGTMIAFFNKTLARAQQDRPLVETGDTTVESKPIQ